MGMKKITVIMILLCVMAFSACNKESDSEKAVIEVQSEEAVYTVARTSLRNVDEKGTLHTIVNSFTRDEEDFLTDMDYVIASYDLEGNLIEEQTLSKALELAPDSIGDDYMLKKLAVREGILYVVVSKEGILELYAYDIENKTEEKLYVFDGFVEIENIVPADGRVYFIGLDEDEYGKDYKGTDKAADFKYEGEVFGYIDIENRSKRVIKLDFPISFSTMPDGNMMVYAYDDVEGYYFAKYDVETDAFETIGYADYGNNLFFMVFDNENHFLYRNLNLGITCASPNKDEGEAVVVEKNGYAGEIYHVGGQLFFLDGGTNIIRRISLEGKIKWNLPIKAIYSEYISSKPFGCGYTVKTEALEEDAFALKILAQDRDYDVSVLDSNKNVAANIKKNGIFYPLNEVEGVMEYLDACFPYIKEAALTEEGQVWMLPVHVEVGVFVYDKKVFEKYGITTDMVADFDGFTRITDKFAEETDLRMDVRYATLKNALMDQYLSKYTNLDTQVFRDNVSFLSERCNKEKAGYIDSSLSAAAIRNWVDEFLYIGMLQSAIMSSSNRMEDCGVFPMPLIEDGIKNQAQCIMMSVNPYSENLENVLNYISEYSKYMLEKKNSFILEDISTYEDSVLCKELYDCYADAEITFRIDEEIFRNNLYMYLEDEITLEEFITESNRKLEAYLNE